MDGGSGRESGRARVAVRGDNTAVARVVQSCGGDVTPSETADYVLAVGEPAVQSLASDPPERPVLPVAADGDRHDLLSAGIHSVLKADLQDALEALFAGEYRVRSHPILTVTLDGEPADRAVLDVTVVTSEPARISEYEITGAGGWVDTVRADGVVVATPVGSAGYARAAGGPVLAHGTGLSVVPIAPFATRTDTWVLQPPVTVTVTREEEDISLYADAREVGRLGPSNSVRLERRDDLNLLCVPGLGRG